MSMVIQHNIPALQTYNIVNNTSNALEKSIAKLSSGLRINSAADDAAGLAISEKMRAQVRGLDKAVANTQDGISLIQTAEGALSETHAILQRMRELSVQAANDTLTQQDRSYIQVEIDQLNEEITRIGNTTQFNKKKLLNGDAAALWSSSDSETKAIINGGLRKTDQFGQKVSVEGNYKIRVKADPGQGEVQKSDIMKIKHENVAINKSVNSAAGVSDVSIEGVPAGKYSLIYQSSATEGSSMLTGSYGLALPRSKSTSTITFGTVDAPVNKISIQTADGVEIWSTSGKDLFQSNGASTDADRQAKFFGGGTTTDNVTFSSLDNEIREAAKAKGIDLGSNSVFDGISQTPTITATTIGTVAPGIKIVYEGDGDVASPTYALTSPGGEPEKPAKDEDVFDVTVTKAAENASILFEVTGIDTVNQTVTLKATANKLSVDGVASTAYQDNIVLKSSGSAVNLTQIFGGKGDDPSVQIELKNSLDQVSEGAKFVYSVTPNAAGYGTLSNSGTAFGIQLDASIDNGWDGAWSGGPLNGQTVDYVLNNKGLADKDIHFNQFYLNQETGTASQGDVILSTNSTFKDGSGFTNAPLSTDDVIASFNAAYIGKVATSDTKLRDLDKFWNSEGTFMLDDAKTITLNQGNGKTASITLYANDTLGDVAHKLNDAIANGLGQGQYVNDATHFATFVNGATSGAETVEGTMVIRTVVPGREGEITLSGDEAVLNALSLNKIQSSKETSFTVDVSDAHTGKSIASNVKVTGNVAHGLIDENVDVEFSSLAGITAAWNANTNSYTYSSSSYDTTLHLADNTTVLQIGANEGEDLAMNIGDMRSHALGLDGVNVMSHERAARSITIIDNAIDRVSTQRANLGAYQNRLEYTANNLTTASENLTSAESRIRDTDMAKEMMNFTKLNIMLQAGNSMLAQANQQPQNVLSLIR